MPKISFAAHISPREASARRSRSPLPPGRGQNRRDPPRPSGNTHAMTVEVDDDDRNLPATCTP
ncbi:hypothetical protein XcuCFBP2542_00055 [Xanthomonas cucurbitae]|uniref:Uncharacterized protein n=1 Tax=Xanthomonas cucurbitae TaxID=56453 RepID=A0A2S7DXY4_9XANT|nr:hypothetical protein XcuCFBP2542_00055 [Xanthomonas cucurbitae]